eukprot:g6345.t1
MSTAPAIEGSARRWKEADAGGGCQNGENCGRLDGFKGCCGGASGTSVTRTSVTTTTTLSATITGAHTPRTTTTTTTTTTVAAITSTTTPSPLVPDLDLCFVIDMHRSTSCRGSRFAKYDLDLCFVFDTTGSMGKYLKQLQEKSTALANDIVNRVREHMPDLPTEKMPRYAVVPYKDFDDANHLSPTTILDFTGDTNKLALHIQPLTAHGGDDTPEDILGALHTATETLSWERAIRFLVIVTDAPGHGPDLNDLGPTGDKEKPHPGVEAPPTVEVAMKDLQSKGINLVFVSCKPAETRKTENAMRDHYNNDEREMTSLALSGAEGWIEKLGDQIVNKLLGRDHM